MIFFSSDTHFCDDASLTMDYRPFANCKSFNKHIVKTWNKTAKRGDVVYFLGDFASCKGANDKTWQNGLAIVKKLKADIVLILGNNEQRIIKHFFEDDFEKFKDFCKFLGFKDVLKNHTLILAEKEFYLTHKPTDFKEGSINLFGHTHRSCGIYKNFGLNVGCDLHHFQPVSEIEIFRLLEMKSKYWDNDKNVNI